MPPDPAAEGKTRFLLPNTFQVPNILCDELLVELSGSELKVLLYIIRRTFGFQREADNISLSQMLNGIRRRDGTIVDRGVGVTKKPLLQALRNLQDRGLIHTERRRSQERGDEPTTYRLTLDGWGYQETTLVESGSGGETPLPVVEKLHHGGGGANPPGAWGRNSTTQNQVARNPALQNSVSSNHFEGQILDIRSEDSTFSRKRDFENKNDDKMSRTLSDGIAPHHGGGFTAVGDVVVTRRKRTSQSRSQASGRVGPESPESIASSAATGPSGRSRRGGRRSLADQATPDIAAVMSQVSDELYDDAERSSLGRAVRLWQQSQASEGNFIAAIYAARKIAKQQGHIEKRASGAAGEHGLRNRMPYFLRVLEDQLGLKQDAPTSY